MACVLVCGTIGFAQENHAKSPATQSTKPAPQQLSVPAVGELVEPDRQIQEIFEKDFKDTSPTGRRQLAAKLLAQSASAATPPEEYALLSNARALAILAGDSATALDANQKVIAKYKVDPAVERLDVVASLSRTVTTSADRGIVISSGFDGADAALHDDEYSTANSFLQAIKPLVEKKETASLPAWRDKLHNVQEASADADAFKSATAILQKNPNEASANSAVGKYYFLRKSNWRKAIPFLAKGSDAKLMALAKDELSVSAAGATTVPSAAENSRLLKLADQWWDLADTQPASERDAIHQHAASFYQEIQPGLSGLTALRVAKRLDALAASPSTPQPAQNAAANPKPAPAPLPGVKPKANDEQLKHDAEELLAESAKDSQRGSHNTPQIRFELLRSFSARTGREERIGSDNSELPDPNARMIPFFLADTGYAEKPDEASSDAPGHISFAAAPLLAAICRNGQGSLVRKIAHDSKQNDAARMTCLLAVQFAGDDIPSTELLPIYEKDTSLECRVVALLMLGSSKISNGEIAKLVTALDDDNQEIRVAAMTTLGLLEPAAALPKLKKVMHDREPADLLFPGFRVLGKLRGDEPSAALIDYMRKELADGAGEHSRLDMALFSLTMTTGRKWIEAGAHKPDYYAKQATDAVAWWHANHP
jgi:hypothetical protein